MQTIWEMDELESAFLAGGPGARHTVADLSAATGLDPTRLLPLLDRMRLGGWAAVSTAPDPRWALTDCGWDRLPGVR